MVAAAWIREAGSRRNESSCGTGVHRTLFVGIENLVMEMTLKKPSFERSERTVPDERSSMRHWTFAAAVSISLTVVCLCVGLSLSVLPNVIETPFGDRFSRAGSILVAAIFPLLYLTAHCLDEIDRADRHLRVAKLNKLKGKGLNTGASGILILLLSLLIIPSTARSQQTIFNVPTTDVLERGGVYVELDAAFKPVNRQALSKFSSFVPRVVVGVGGDVEVGLNVVGNVQPGADTTTLVPTVKWRFYRNPKYKTDLIAGTNLYVPVRRRSYDLGTYSYVAGSKSIGKARLTAGAFVASKNVFAANAVRAGGQFGFEYSLNGKVSLAADWMTGRHSNGYFTPGVIYKPHPRVTTYWSYAIGNSDALMGNHFFLLEVGYNF